MQDHMWIRFYDFQFGFKSTDADQVGSADRDT